MKSTNWIRLKFSDSEIHNRILQKLLRSDQQLYRMLDAGQTDRQTERDTGTSEILPHSIAEFVNLICYVWNQKKKHQQTETEATWRET